MHYQITEEEINKILSAEGEVRGVVFKTDYRYIIDNFGVEGLKKVEAELEVMNCNFDYETEIDNMSFYPVGMRVLSIIAISRAFNLDSEGVKRMGFNAPKVSLMIKFFMRYFLSPEKVMEKAGEMWNKHYTIGKLKVGEVNNKENYMKGNLSGIKLHPIFCDYLLGYFTSIVKMGAGKEVKGDEVKCAHKGDQHHEFLLTW